MYESLLETCSKFDNFFRTTKCYPLRNRMQIPMENYCGYVKFKSSDFLHCFIELSGENSACYQGSVNRPPPLMETANNETMDFLLYCKNYFGTDNCMKETIIKRCGEKIWQEYRIVRIFKNNRCDFSEM